MNTTKIPKKACTVAANPSLCRVEWATEDRVISARGLTCGWSDERRADLLDDTEAFFAWIDHHHSEA